MNNTADMKLSQEQQNQEDEYVFPYHHVPALGADGFTQTYTWTWGLPYLGGIRFVTDKVANIGFDSLIDIGCGDGRFLAEVSKQFPKKRLMGVDYSRRAVSFAKAFCPQLDFRCMDLIGDELAETFDIATMIEVYEHIPPNICEDFLRAATGKLNSRGTMIVTVPHSNTPLQEKHYRHFDAKTLVSEFGKFFESVTIVPFDRRSLLLRLLDNICNRPDFIFSRQRIMNARWRHYIDYCLHDANEENCRRIAAVCSGKRMPN